MMLISAGLYSPVPLSARVRPRRFREAYGRIRRRSVDSGRANRHQLIYVSLSLLYRLILF